eukprot:2748890-Prymnesium_polylepis.1
MHMIAGTCKDVAAAQKDGRLQVAAIPCACVSCTALRFDDCEMKELIAQKPVKLVKTPRTAGDTAGLRLMESLQVTAATATTAQPNMAGTPP